MHIVFFGLVLFVIGAAYITFVFVEPPDKLEQTLNGFSRRVRFLVQFLPDEHQQRGGRILTGLICWVGAAAAISWVFTGSAL